MLRTCAACGQPMTATAAFCGNCGQPAWRACPQCGGPTAEGARWCSTCGANLAGFAGVPLAAPPSQPTAPPAPPYAQPAPPYAQVAQPAYRAAPAAPDARAAGRGLSRRAILLVVAVAVAVGAAGGAWYLQRSTNGQDNPADPPAANFSPLPNDQAGPIPAEQPITPVTGRLTLGDPTPLVSGSVGSAAITLAQSGFSLQFPAGSFKANVPVAVSQAPITAQTFGKLVTPVTPLYHVDTGGTEPAAPVTVVLPMPIPAGSTAMAFSYDDATGTITPLAPQTEDQSSLTVVATHFSDMFGGIMDSLPPTIFVDSGFRPGKDDWEFTNFGSYVAPGGHCNGQSITALWYFAEQYRKAHAPRLYSTYDNNGNEPKTPDLWMDDSFGYRFASSVQVDSGANPFTVHYFSNILHSPDGRKTYQAFWTAIHTTGEPQLVWIGSEEQHIAHAMIVYAVESDGLLIADPNYPGQRRIIPYDAASGTLGPYESGANAAVIASGGEETYTRFAYMPWRSPTSEDRLAELWTDFKDGKIGNAVFPMVGMEVYEAGEGGADGRWTPLTDGYETAASSIRLRITTESAHVKGAFGVYRDATEVSNRQFERTVELQPGSQTLGFSLWAPGWDGEKWVWSYVDFQHFTVISGATGVQVSVSPTSITDPSAFHTLLIDLSNIPSSVTSFKTVVDWGDGRAPQVLANRSPDADGKAHVVMTSIYPPPNGGKDVTQITVSFQDANGNPLSSCPESTSGQPSGGCRKWPTVRIPVVQPSAAPSFASASIEIWMGHCQNCLDFRPGRPIRLVAGEPGVYTGDPADLAAMGLASLDLQVGDNGRTITSLRVVYADDPDHWFVLTNIPITATETDPTDQKVMADFLLGSWGGIMPHLQWQAIGTHGVVTQADWIEDSSSVGQEYMYIHLKRP